MSFVSRDAAAATMWHFFTDFLTVLGTLPPGKETCLPATNSINVSWPAAGATLYELQYEEHRGVKQCPTTPFLPYASLTSVEPFAKIEDLYPAALYRLRLRFRDDASVWHASSIFCCQTTRREPTIPWVHVPLHAPSTSAFTVSVDAPLPASGVAVNVQLQCRIAAPPGQWHVCGVLNNVTAPNATLSIGSLKSGTAYEVRAALLDGSQPGQPSDPVTHHTASDEWESLPVYRFSELCGDACEPDFLYNHDSGGALADAAFLAHSAAVPDDFNVTFNTSVTSRYCLSRRRGPYADYLSCNGPTTEEYTCTCNVFIDRCIGRLDISVCDASQPFEFMPPCYCTNASTAFSAGHIGRMPVYMPWMSWPPDFSHGTCDDTPPLAESFFVGYYYSTPAAAECEPTMTPTRMRRANPLATCSWSRRRALRMVHGRHLLERGLDTNGTKCSGRGGGGAGGACSKQVHHNAEVMLSAFAEHPDRCCGC